MKNNANVSFLIANVPEQLFQSDLPCSPLHTWNRHISPILCSLADHLWCSHFNPCTTVSGARPDSSSQDTAEQSDLMPLLLELKKPRRTPAPRQKHFHLIDNTGAVSVSMAWPFLWHMNLFLQKSITMVELSSIKQNSFCIIAQL